MIVMTNNKRKKDLVYKVRKSGNSDITTLPSEVKEALGIQPNDYISYSIGKDNSVVIKKAEPQVNIDQLIKESMTQYHDLLNKMADL